MMDKVMRELVNNVATCKLADIIQICKREKESLLTCLFLSLPDVGCAGDNLNI